MTVRPGKICVYCRGRLCGDVVSCVRHGCGARYHVECWEECSAHHRTCAVFGCRGLETLPEKRVFSGRVGRIDVGDLIGIVAAFLAIGSIVTWKPNGLGLPNLDACAFFALAFLLIGPRASRVFLDAMVQFARGFREAARDRGEARRSEGG